MNKLYTKENALIITAFVDSFGTGLFYAVSALFFTLYVGIPSREVGLGLMAAGLCGLVATVPLAKIADRYDPVRTLAVIQLTRGLLFLGYLAVGSVTGFVLVACLLGCLQRPVAPITQGVIVRVSSHARRIDALAKMRVVRNVGLGLGSLAASAALAGGHRAAFVGLLIGDSTSFFFATVMLLRIRKMLQRTDIAAPQGAPGASAYRRLPAVLDMRYMAAALCNGTLTLHQSALEVGLALWIVKSRTAAPFVPAALVTVNTLLVIFLQVRVARGAKTIHGVRKHIAASAACLAVFSVLTAVSASAGTDMALVCFAVGIVALTFGEMWQSSSSWFVGNEFADPRRRSEYLAAYSLGNTVQTILGPAVFSVLVIPAGALGWGVLAAVFLGVGGIYPPIVNNLELRARRIGPPAPSQDSEPDQTDISGGSSGTELYRNSRRG